MKDSNEKKLITGGSGLLSSHFINLLLKEGYGVVCIDNLQTGSLRNIQHMLDRITFVEHDITEPLPALGSFDEIYNLACPVSLVHYQVDQIHTYKTSVLGAFHLLEVARKTNAEIFQVSTSEVYGDLLVHLQLEGCAGHANSIGIRRYYD